MPASQLAHPLPDPAIELVARRFRILSEPSRIKLLELLRAGPASVGQLCAATGFSQQNASKHLGILHNAGIVAREKRGTAAIYSIADESVYALCEQVCGGIRRQLDELGAAFVPN